MFMFKMNPLSPSFKDPVLSLERIGLLGGELLLSLTCEAAREWVAESMEAGTQQLPLLGLHPDANSLSVIQLFCSCEDILYITVV